MRAKVIFNCGIEEGGRVMALPFFKVQNKRGHFVAHWTAAPENGELDPEHFGDMGRMKASQLGVLQAPWLHEEGKRLDIIQVVDGKSGTMQQKIKSYCEDILPGSRVIFVLPSRKDDGAIYRALNLLPPDNSKYSTMEQESMSCGLPFQIFDLGELK